MTTLTTATTQKPPEPRREGLEDAHQRRVSEGAAWLPLLRALKHTAGSILRLWPSAGDTVYARERERECVCVCVCVCERA